MTGYVSPDYARSLAAFGLPLELPDSQGWLLKRQIPNSDLHDAMGCYPLFSCSRWPALGADLEHLSGRVVTVTLVVDPFAQVTHEDLKTWFHVVAPFKEHFVIDTSQPTEDHVGKHHRYYARKALKDIRVDLVTEPGAFLEEWSGLYDFLIRRHRLTGIKAFSQSSFALQLQIPGVVLFRASHNGATVGAHMWFLQGGVAYSHLAAYNDQGYELGAAYALYWTAIQMFKERFAREIRWIDLGGGAGIAMNGGDGLGAFKRGWTTKVKTKYMCGKIIDSDAYKYLTRQGEQMADLYFPAYRSGELFLQSTCAF